MNKVLIVDDSILSRETLKKYVINLGFDPICAKDGVEAIEVLKSEVIDVVLLDIIMPKLDGYGVLAYIKQDDSLKIIPVIMITSVEKKESIVKCIEAGADDYLPKPFDLSILQARLSASLEKKYLRDKEIKYKKDIENYSSRLIKSYQQVKEEYKARIVAERKINKIKIKIYIILVSIFLSLSLIVFFNIHDFLSVNKPIKADVMIVDRCFPVDKLKIINEDFIKCNYQIIITTGKPVKNKHYKTHAEHVRNELIKLGLDEEHIKDIPTALVEKDRTYTSAVKIKDWMDNSNIASKTINIYSYGVHSRRSLYLYQKAFGSNYNIGIISLENDRYNLKRWWKSSIGVRTIIDETIAFLYAVFLFRP
ncbi:hypothetical protein BVX93_01720 [bacterium B13(2017)]|nr:hypothetical protein BVX93_01720 [bacterium B13(2017)]